MIVFLIYLAVFYGVWIVTGVDYERIGDDPGTLLKWYVAPTWVGGLVLAGAVTWLGWWRPVLFEKERARERWILIAPAYMVLVAVLVAITADHSGTTADMIPFLILGSLGVGFAEEVSSRGVLVTGFRSRMTEPQVWFLSCLLFGLLHLPNWVFGVGPAAVFQVLLAFGAGSVLYLLRRGTGTLVWAMALHALWDFASLSGERPSFLTGLVLGNAFVGVVLGVMFMRRERGHRIEQAGVPEAPGTAPTPA